MIFATAGNQFSFERLGEALSDLTKNKLINEEVFYQSFEKEYDYPFNSSTVLNQKEYMDKLRLANLVVSHAGMGTILTCRDFKKPLIVLPRMLKFNEHRNDHQLATCKQIQNYKFLKVAWTVEELKELIINYSQIDFTFEHQPVKLKPLQDFLKEQFSIF